MTNSVQTDLTFSDFSDWDPERYLREYFLPDVDGEPAVKFIVEESRRLQGQPVVVDIGCGPTVCYWSALAPHVSGIYVADYLNINLAYVRKWVNSEPGMYDWSSYSRFLLEYEGGRNFGAGEILARENLSRSKVLDYLHCDITTADPLGPVFRGQYNGLLSVYCADSITDDKLKWRIYMQNIFSLLRSGGLFIGAAMHKCRHYDVGRRVYPAANLSETDFIDLMCDSGFDTRSIRVEVANESRLMNGSTPRNLRPEYDRVILASGLLRD